MNNWNKVKLGHVSTLQFGYAYKSEQFIANEIPVIRIGDITENGLIPDYNCCYSKDFWEKHPELQLHENSILIAMSGATVGKSCLNNRKEKLLLNQRVTSVIATEKAITNYLLYAIKSDSFKSYVLKASMGCAQPNISGKQISDFQIPLPPIETQKQIAATLDKVTKIISENKKLLEKYDLLIKSRFIEMFGDNKYPIISISEMVEGKVPSAKKLFNKTDEIKYIDISSVDNKINEIVGYTEYIFEEAPSRAQQHIRKNDILISTVRPNLKNIAINRLDYKEMVASSGFCVLRPKCVPEYLFVAVLQDKFTSDMVAVTTGANYPAIKDSDVLNYEISNPPLELQQQFAAFVQQIDKSKFAVQKSLEKTEILYKSLMQAYFG